jgi:hypothetical protein
VFWTFWTAEVRAIGFWTAPAKHKELHFLGISPKNDPYSLGLRSGALQQWPGKDFGSEDLQGRM